MKNNLSRSAKQRLWQEHIAKWKRTKLTRAEYCIRNKISLRMFEYWIGKTKHSSSAPALVELKLPKSLPLPSSHPQFCLIIEQRFRIEIYKGFDAQDLEHVVRVLGRI